MDSSDFKTLLQAKISDLADCLINGRGRPSAPQISSLRGLFIEYRKLESAPAETELAKLKVEHAALAERVSQVEDVLQMRRVGQDGARRGRSGVPFV